MRRHLLPLLALFVVSRLALVAVGVVSMARLAMNTGQQFTHLLDDVPALDMWYRWDAGFYATIATDGYRWFTERRAADDMAFFPLYPLLTRAVMALLGTTDTAGCAVSPYLSTCATVAGLIVSNVALFVGVVLLFDLTVQFAAGGRAADHPYDVDVGSGRAVWAGYAAAVLVLVSPGSVYLSGVYTEAVFFALTTLTLWLLSRERFGWAVAAACLAALTRSVGVALVPALLVYVWGRRSLQTAQTQSATLSPQSSPSPVQSVVRNPQSFLVALLPALVCAVWIVGIGLYVGDARAYFSAYASTWDRATASPVEAFTVYFSGEDVAWFGWRLSWIDLIATLGYGALGVWVWRANRVWGAFALAAILIPIATGSLLSMPRFGTVIAPFYSVLGAWVVGRAASPSAWRIVRAALVYGSAAALALLITSRFVTWRWIA